MLRRRTGTELTAPAAGAVAGAAPSAPVVGSRQLEAFCQRVFAGQEAICQGDLAAARDAELLAEGVAMCLRRARRDAQLGAELLVRQSLGDQLDHLPLPVGD